MRVWQPGSHLSMQRAEAEYQLKQLEEDRHKLEEQRVKILNEARTQAQRELVLCHVCGDMMQRAGSCYACPSCGSNNSWTPRRPRPPTSRRGSPWRSPDA